MEKQWGKKGTPPMEPGRPKTQTPALLQHTTELYMRKDVRSLCTKILSLFACWDQDLVSSYPE